VTRADMFVNPKREDWMTPELEVKLKSLAKDDKISCYQSQKFAEDNNIQMNKMKAFLDVAGLKVQNCQLGCF
jgi:hypothetical protein